MLLSSLGSLYDHPGGIGERLGGPSGRAEGLTGGGELFGVEVVGEVTTTLGNGNGKVRDAGNGFGEDGNDSVNSCCPELSVSC